MGTPGNLTADELVRAVADLLEANHDRRLTGRELAASVGYSTRHLRRRFRRATGTTPHAKLTENRAARAGRLRAEGEKVDVVALLVGYQTRASLYRNRR